HLHERSADGLELMQRVAGHEGRDRCAPDDHHFMRDRMQHRAQRPARQGEAAEHHDDEQDHPDCRVHYPLPLDPPQRSLSNSERLATRMKLAWLASRTVINSCSRVMVVARSAPPIWARSSAPSSPVATRRSSMISTHPMRAPTIVWAVVIFSRLASIPPRAACAKLECSAAGSCSARPRAPSTANTLVGVPPWSKLSTSGPVSARVTTWPSPISTVSAVDVPMYVPVSS